MSNVHILPDENLGGVLREYVEVNRKAKAGEKIVIVRPDEGSAYEKGDILTVEKSYENHPEYEDGVRIAEDYYFIYHSEYHTLEPTDIVHIDGARYRIVDRKAKVGEKVIVTNALKGERDKCPFDNGHISEVIAVAEAEISVKPCARLYHFEYHVLESVEPAEKDSDLVTAEEGDPKSTLDLLANLARRVTELERKFEKLESRQKRLMGRIADTEEKIEKILDDIVTLDERTQPLVKPFGEESPFATVATIPTFKYSELIGKTLKIYGGRDGEYATVFGYDATTGKSYVLFNGKESGDNR
jgi:hypothetical protein